MHKTFIGQQPVIFVRNLSIIYTDFSGPVDKLSAFLTNQLWLFYNLLFLLNLKVGLVFANIITVKQLY